MPVKGKAASTSDDDVKHNTRASTSASAEEPVPGLQAWLTSIAIPSLQATIQASLDSRFQALESEIAELKAAQVIQPPAPAPAVTPAIEPPFTKSIPFRADEVGYFDPDLDETQGEGDMVTIGKDLWFRDVFLFTDRLKDVAVTKADAVRGNWTSCLRGTALSWYQDEWASYDTWRTQTLDFIIEELISRFRDPPDKALRKLNSLQFTITSIQEGKKPASYVHQVIRAARNAGFDSHQNQLSFAYDHLQVELRTQIDRPTVNTTVSSFIQQLTNKYINWQELYSLPARRFAYQGNYGQYRQYDQVQYASQQQVMPQQQRDYYMQRNDKDKYNRHVPRAIKPPPNYSSQNRQPWKATTGPPIIKAEANHRAAKVTDVDDDDTDEVMQEPQGYAFNYDAHNRDSPFTPFDSYDPYFR
jgi:hypothetical protein